MQHYLLTFGTACGIIMLSRGGNTSGSWETRAGVELLAEAVCNPTFRHATFLKEISKNLLTNNPRCAIISTQREGSEAKVKAETHESRVRPRRQSPLTARCSCLRYTNVNQTTQAEKMSWIRRIHKPLFIIGAPTLESNHP